MPVNESPNNLKTSKHKSKTKKINNEKEVKTPVQVSENKVSENTNLPATAVQKAASLEWFTSEIQSMMFGFGDCRYPLLESAQLIEEIVHQQMNSLLLQSAEIANIRNSRFIGLEDIVFLMRKDKTKISRLLHYLSVKDTRNTIAKNCNLEEEDIADTGGESKVQPRLKRAKLCQDFLNSISLIGGLYNKVEDEVVDEVKIEREIRADQQTANMDQNQYLEYSEARRASFARKYRSTKFRDWLLKDNLTEIKPNPIAIEIFHYLAYETVAQIVDLALLVKQDAQGNSCDPFTRLIPPVVYNPEYPNIQIAQNLKQCQILRPDSPSQSSASPPSSPGSQDRLQHPSTSLNKPKPKKRRRSDGKSSYDLSGSRCIQPADIREAIRRYWKPSGPLMLFSKHHHNYLGTRLMCC
ncbi:transcription initiation protein SPT3 homolog [Centruroides vittatus]|uniref:transcription initiation protein SPT3 homolog n=1 Tax=Centruroides vittatus TaxID=120091 RepID=UPI00350F3CF5